jgi:hypothetical protein
MLQEWSLSLLPTSNTISKSSSLGVALTNQETEEIVSLPDYSTRKIYRFLRLPPDTHTKETRVFTRSSFQSQSAETIEDKPLEALAVLLMGVYTSNRNVLQPVLMELCSIDSASSLLVNDFLSLPPPFYRQLLSHRHRYTHWSLGVYYLPGNKHASLHPGVKGFEPSWIAYMNTNNRYEINEMSHVDLVWLAQSQHFKPYAVLEYIDEFGIYKPELQIPPVITALCQSQPREGLYSDYGVPYNTEQEHASDLYVIITELIGRYGKGVISDEAIRAAHDKNRTRISHTLELLKSQTRIVYLKSASSSSSCDSSSPPPSALTNGLHTVELHDAPPHPLLSANPVSSSRCRRCLGLLSFPSCVIL